MRPSPPAPAGAGTGATAGRPGRDHGRRHHLRLAGARDQPPAELYFPPGDSLAGSLTPVAGRGRCERNGRTGYLDVTAGSRRASRANWCYRGATPPFAAIRGHVAFNPALVDACWVDDEPATAQEGSLYGGWIAARIVGPFKGGPGSMGW